MAGELEEVYSQLIPVAGSKLILPRLSVAEVQGFGRPRSIPGAPPWLLGMISWERQNIPLVSFEGLCGNRIPEPSNRTRIAVVYAIGGLLDPPVMGFMTQGYPYLVRVNPIILQLQDDVEIAEDEPVLNRVRMANERPVIPDLEAIESRVADAMGHLAAAGSGGS